MTSNIYHQARKHLLHFLKKVEDQNYTRNEYESFQLMSYQTPEFERIRTEVCSLISASNKTPDVSGLTEEMKGNLNAFIDFLEQDKT